MFATPTIHLNGTSPDRLKTDLMVVINGLRAALGSMEAAAPNARDYYPQGGWAFPIARRGHEERCAKLQAMLAEHVAMLDALQDRIDGVA